MGTQVANLPLSILPQSSNFNFSDQQNNIMSTQVQLNYQKNKKISKETVIPIGNFIV